MSRSELHTAATFDIFWKHRRVFVTGGTGLIGSWLVKQMLRSSAEVVLLVKDLHPDSEIVRSGDIARCAVVYGQLEDYATLESAINSYETETVFHLGAQTLVGVAHRSPLATFEANVRGTYNLLEACRTHKDIVRRIIVASSDKAYGDQPVLPYTEDMSLDAKHSYDVTKSCTDLISQAYAHTYRLPIGVTRFGNVYGGGDLNLSRIVPGTIRSLHAGQRPVIRSNGLYTRDYLYVEDVVAGYMCLAQALENADLHGQAFNFSSETRVSVMEIVQLISRIMNAERLQPDIRNNAEAEILHQHLRAEKARRLLGWEAATDLETGLRRTISWYQEMFDSSSA